MPVEAAMSESISLVLSDEERELLFDILEERQRTLLCEIAHTDHHDFKVALQKKEQLLESLLSRFITHA
jgi:hypothetical protein